MSNDNVMQGLIRERQLLQTLPFSESTLRRKVKAGEFPSPIRLSDRVVAWRIADVSEWLQSRPKNGC